MTRRPLAWVRDGRDWPNRETSRFAEAGGLTWHVQVAGQGPVLLLLHGTGASTHSWRDLLPRLAEHFTVVAPDLPGHAFTTAPQARRMSLPGMGTGLAALLDELKMTPALAAGHSAGAAIAIAMTLDGLIQPAGLVSLNGALLPIGGVAGQVFSPLARLLARSRTASHLFASWADDDATLARLLAQTGSRLDPRGLSLYRRLAGNAVHVTSALAMMAHWDLATFGRRLPLLAVPLLLVVGTRDGSISPLDAEKVRRCVPAAIVERFRGLGHLAHEEDPDATANLICRYAIAWGLELSPPGGAPMRPREAQ